MHAIHLNLKRYHLLYRTLLNKLRIVADDHNKITHDKENKIFTIEDVKSPHLSLPSWGILSKIL